MFLVFFVCGYLMAKLQKNENSTKEFIFFFLKIINRGIKIKYLWQNHENTITFATSKSIKL